MKIRLLSDLHMEGFRYNYEYAGEDVVVLAGDIHTRNRHYELISQIPDHVNIVMVAGNHEYYHSDMTTVNDFLSGLSEMRSNFHFLDNSSVQFGDVKFIGGTMWSDFGLWGEVAGHQAEKYASNVIRDFSCIEISHNTFPGCLRSFTTTDCKELHKEWDDYVSRQFNATQRAGTKLVLLTHFCTSENSVHPRFADSPVNPYFTSNKEHMFEYCDLVIHGHTHDSFDYVLNGARVVCNPKGYGNENPNFNPNLIIEI